MDEATRNAVDRLLELVPPPRRRVSSGDWSQTEAELRTPLPSDFVELATAWGDGVLVDHVTFAPADRFVERCERWVGWEQESWDAIGEPAPRLWPALGGLLPWADTSNGDRLWWKTGDAASDTWTVATQEARSFDFEETEWTCAELLLAFLEGRTELFGGFDRSVAPWFRPTRDQFHIELAAPAGAAVPAEEELVTTVAEVLPVHAHRGRWSDGRSFQRHWVSGQEEWDVSAETRGLRLTVPIEQESEAREAAAEVGRRLGFTWEESWVSRTRRDEVWGY